MSIVYDRYGIIVHHADNRDVLPTLKEGSVDAIVTDPPFLNSESGIIQDHSCVATVSNPTLAVGIPWGYSLDWVEMAAKLRPKHWVVFAHFKMLGGLCSALEKHAEISTVFAWRKSNAPNMARPVPRLDCEFIVWARRKGQSCGRMGEFGSMVIDVPNLQAGFVKTERILDERSRKAFHPCQKPLKVIQPFVDRLDVETFLDPFAGTGTTGVACRKSGRRCILVEGDPKYIPIVVRRLRDAETPPLAAIGD